MNSKKNYRNKPKVPATKSCNKKKSCSKANKCAKTCLKQIETPQIIEPTKQPSLFSRILSLVGWKS